MSGDATCFCVVDVESEFGSDLGPFDVEEVDVVG